VPARKEQTVSNAEAIEALPNGLVLDWVRPVTAPVLWICQPPRSGGTLLLRLLDSHPQLHNFPSVFGFTNPEMIWPTSQELAVPTDKLLHDVFAKMSLAKFDRSGMAKQSSNMEQDRYPIYFDQDWFEAIFTHVAGSRDDREKFNTLFTAVFNAWRNYQSLYFEKKYVVGHMTMRWGQLEHYVENHRRFAATYPDGRMIFMTREPDDWMASYTSLKKATPYSGKPQDAVDYYKAHYRQALELAPDSRLVVFRFKDLLTDGEATLRRLADELGIDWNPLLLQPTFNGAPWYQNSSFDHARKAGIDESVMGQGKNLRGEVAEAMDDEMWQLYEALAGHALKIG
jgi:hypothetical protein